MLGSSTCGLTEGPSVFDETTTRNGAIGGRTGETSRHRYEGSNLLPLLPGFQQLLVLSETIQMRYLYPRPDTATPHRRSNLTPKEKARQEPKQLIIPLECPRVDFLNSSPFALHLHFPPLRTQSLQCTCQRLALQPLSPETLGQLRMAGHGRTGCLSWHQNTPKPG